MKSISWIKAEWEEVSDQRVTNCFRECGFCNKAQDEVVPTLDQNEDEEFANLVKEVAGDVDPDNYVDFGKEEVDAGSICWRQEIRKETIEKHENPVDEVMHVSSDEDVDKRLNILKESSPILTPCKWWIKAYGSLISLITRNLESQL